MAISGRPPEPITVRESPQVAPTKEGILAMFASLRLDSLQFWRRIDVERFWSRHDGAWSPSDNVHHLVISTVPVSRALRIPRLILRACFGVSRTPSRSWEALRSTYLDSLASGATAGRYAPIHAAPPLDTAAEQLRLVGQCESTVFNLENAIKSWGEVDLDRYRLPHPILGRLTLREMLMFTLFHFDHHRGNVARRLTDRSFLSGSFDK